MRARKRLAARLEEALSLEITNNSNNNSDNKELTNKG
jgi:hypothetical protein